MQLWLHRLMHQGPSTKAPSLSSMPDKERHYRPQVFYPGADFSPGTRPLSWKGTCRRTVSLRRTGVPKPTSLYSFRAGTKWKTRQERSGASSSQLLYRGLRAEIVMKSYEMGNVARDIAAAEPPPHSVAMWWLGQASIALRGAGTTLYIDPFFSDNPDRLVPPPFAPTMAAPADYVLCTHEHVDHFDPQTLPGLAQASPHARFVVPLPVVEQTRALGIAPERVVGIQPGEVVQLGAVTLFSVPACHGLKAPLATYDFGFVEREGKNLYSFLGYILEIGGVRIYHAGDTVIFDGLVERLRELEIDLAFLPINGRSYFREQRNIVGNIDEREAADLAAAAGVKLLVPIHYEMFAANQGRPGALVDYVQARYPQLSCLIPAHGRRFTFTKGDGR